MDQEALLSRLAPVWELIARGGTEEAAQAEMAVCAAVLSARSPALRRAAPDGYEPLSEARQAMGQSHPLWGWLWRQLYAAYPHDRLLEADALAWLERELPVYNPQWSPAWGRLVEEERRDARLPALGRHWLERHAWQPDWNYVFRIVLKHWPEQTPTETRLSPGGCLAWQPQLGFRLADPARLAGPAAGASQEVDGAGTGVARGPPGAGGMDARLAGAGGLAGAAPRASRGTDGAGPTMAFSHRTSEEKGLELRLAATVREDHTGRVAEQVSL